MLFCAIEGMIAVMCGALVFNWIVEKQFQKVLPYFVFIMLLICLCYDQMKIIDFQKLPAACLGFMFVAFPALCLLGISVTLVFSTRYGVGRQEVCKRMDEIHQMREQLLAKWGALWTLSGSSSIWMMRSKPKMQWSKSSKLSSACPEILRQAFRVLKRSQNFNEFQRPSASFVWPLSSPQFVVFIQATCFQAERTLSSGADLCEPGSFQRLQGFCAMPCLLSTSF